MLTNLTNCYKVYSESFHRCISIKTLSTQAFNYFYILILLFRLIVISSTFHRHLFLSMIRCTLTHLIVFSVKQKKGKCFIPGVNKFSKAAILCLNLSLCTFPAWLGKIKIFILQTMPKMHLLIHQSCRPVIF